MKTEIFANEIPRMKNRDDIKNLTISVAVSKLLRVRQIVLVFWAIKNYKAPAFWMLCSCTWCCLSSEVK